MRGLQDRLIEDSKEKAGTDPGNNQRASSRERVLNAACQLFYEHGYASASMRDLASAVGMTQAAIYYHFANKEEILFALVAEFNDRLYNLLVSAFASEANPEDGLRTAIEAHILLGRSCFREFKLVTEDKQKLTSDCAKQMHAREREIFDLYKNAITAIQNQKTSSSVDATVCTFNIISMINFIFKWYKPDGKLSLEAIAHQTVTFSLAGVNYSDVE